jgi:hypothetical protein
MPPKTHVLCAWHGDPPAGARPARILWEEVGDKIAPGRAILQWEVARENRLGATVDAAT